MIHGALTLVVENGQLSIEANGKSFKLETEFDEVAKRFVSGLEKFVSENVWQDPIVMPNGIKTVDLWVNLLEKNVGTKVLMV